MSKHSFTSYLDAMLVIIADQQNDQTTPVNLISLHLIKFIKCPATWAQLAGPEMERRGWGRMHHSFYPEGFLINGAGLAHAHDVRTKLNTSPLMRFFSGFTRSDWIAIGAFAVSVIALIKGN